MKKTLLWALLLAALLALCCGAAAAEPWAGSGTESDPWRITSAADLVALREYVAAGEITSGKYFKQTENISLSSVCGEGVGDWIPIGSDDTGKYFNGTYDGGSHTLSGLYIGNGGNHSALFVFLPAGTTIKNLNVAGHVKGGYETGGIVGSNKGVIENCSFTGNVQGTENRAGGIAGFAGNQSGSIISNSTVDGNISGIINVGGVAGFIGGQSIENCSFSGTVTGTGDSVGGIVGGSLGALTGCTSAGDITGSSNYVGGIAGVCYGDTIKNCTYQSGTVTGEDQVGGIVGLGNALLIENCKSYGNVSSATNRAGGIAGETCGPIKGCENHGQVSSTHYAGGITGHTFSGLGLTGTVENCKNYGDVTVNEMYVGGIVGGAEVPITNCENHGKIQGDEHVGGIAGDSDSTVTGCTNDGLAMGEYRVGFIVGGHGGSVVTLKPNGAPGNDIVIAMDPLIFSKAPECPYWHDYLNFFAWNTKADGTGTWYRVGDPVGDGKTLYAIWMNTDSITYEKLDGDDEYMWARFLDGYFMETGVTGLPGGWYLVKWDTNLTFPGRLYLSGDVNLILGNGSTLTCNGGIDVPPGSSLTIWKTKNGVGTLNATGAEHCAGIGGGSGQSNGKITINGGTVNATGNYGAGIGGGDLAAGGAIVINGGSVTAIGGNGGAGIGGGPYANGGTVTINGGAVSATGSSYSETGQSGAGIGAGRPRTNGSQTLNGGTVTINGGTVIANAGIDPTVGANAIGANFQYSNPGTLTIARGLQAMVYFFGDGPVPYADRVDTCRGSLVMVQPCVDHSFRDGRCDYCDMEVAVWNLFEGYGTEGSPFLIQNTDDWNRLASLFNEDRLHNSSYTYKLMDNISVTTMIGTENNPFRGTFDGNGKTLTFNCENHPERTAPFLYADSVSIRNLHVAGSITGTNQRASGLIGENSGSSTVTNCRVSATLSGSRLISGFCIGTGGTLNIVGCVFDGQITGSPDQSGCFAAWGTSGLSITDSIAAPKSGTAFTGGMFCYAGGGTPTLNNCYYLTAIAAEQGRQVFSVTGSDGVTVDFGTPGTVYNVSGVATYPAGVKYGGVFYAGKGDTVALDLTAEEWAGHANAFTASAGTLTAESAGYTLTMPGEAVTISVRRTPTFATAPAVRLTADGGTDGYNDQDPDKLFDGLTDNSHKWCCVFDGSNYVEFHSDVPVVPTAYAMTTAGDAANYLRRNPYTWELWGKTNASDEAWTLLASEAENDHLPAENCVEIFFPLNNSAAYQYYRLKVTAVRSGSQLQIGEFKLIGTPVFGTPDFTLPSFLTAVEEEAFAGIAASAVDVPASCLSIGDRAFVNCPNLTRIRIPAGCALGTDVFEGCTMVYVFGTAGSSAEAYCQAHGNCVFVPAE